MKQRLASTSKDRAQIVRASAVEGLEGVLDARAPQLETPPESSVAAAAAAAMAV